MNKIKINPQLLWISLVFVLSGWFYIYHRMEPARFIKAIRAHKIDTIYENDSAYVIKAKIDTVFFKREKRVLN